MYMIKPTELSSYIGKKVNTEQLENILDTYMILTDVKLVKDKLGIGSLEGILDEVSETPVRLSKRNSTIVYNDSFERDEYCGYE